MVHVRMIQIVIIVSHGDVLNVMMIIIKWEIFKDVKVVKQIIQIVNNVMIGMDVLNVMMDIH